MRNRIAFLLPVVLLACQLHAQTTAPSQSDFLRLIDKGSTGSRLETADVAFRNSDGVVVHLIAAVHVGEREYFEGLNQNFKLHDAVLYEMVKPRDVKMPVKPDEHVETQSAVSQVQRTMKDVLGLEFQLDVVDYSAPNFIHADLDAETFEKMQAERGESFTNMMLQALIKSMTAPPDENANADAQDFDKQLEDIVQMFTRPDMHRQIKLRFAREMVKLENNPMGPDALSGTVLLTERNNAALASLDRTVKSGKKDIGIFYGAAHMPELSQKLGERGFKPIATEWRMAWDLTIRADEPSAVEKALMEMLKGLDDDGDGN